MLMHHKVKLQRTVQLRQRKSNAEDENMKYQSWKPNEQAHNEHLHLLYYSILYQLKAKVLP